MHTRSLVVSLLVPVVLALGLGTARAADPAKRPDEFRGIRWGAQVAGIQGMTQVDRDGDIIHYDRAGEKMDLGGIPLRHVTYSFYKGQFYHADIAYEGADAFEALQRSLEEKYGPPDTVRQKTDASGQAYEVAIWNWPGTVFIGNRHEKNTNRGRIFYFYAPLTETSAKSQGVAPGQAAGQPAGQGRTYTVAKGDSLSRLARKFGVSEADLSKANNGLTDMTLKAGATIAIPAAASAKGQPAPAPVREPSQAPQPRSAAPEAAGQYVTYTVKDGDILSKVANAHGARTKDVIAANPGINPDALRPGTSLRIPVKTSGAPETVTAPAAP